MIQHIVLPVETTMTYVSEGDGDKCYQLMVGSRGNASYWSYLHFDVESLKKQAEIAYAKMVLFKIPRGCEAVKESYACVPAKDYMTPYSYCYEAPALETGYELTFEVDERSAYVEIDVTAMLKAWLTGTIKDRGIIIYGKPHTQLSYFGTLDNKNMAPILEIGIYKEDLEPVAPIYSFPLQIKISS